nr:hypothetical protein [Chryseobacterium candidae]
MTRDTPDTTIYLNKEESSFTSLLTSKPKQPKVIMARLKALNAKGLLINAKVL